MTTQKKSSKSGGKKPQVKVSDMKPAKDAKGGTVQGSRIKFNQN
jgi:hypothetical protein